jgi:hypothetical protein
MSSSDIKHTNTGDFHVVDLAMQEMQHDKHTIGAHAIQQHQYKAHNDAVHTTHKTQTSAAEAAAANHENNNVSNMSLTSLSLSSPSSSSSSSSFVTSSHASTSLTLRAISLVVLCLQNASLILSMRYARSVRQEQYLDSVSTDKRGGNKLTHTLNGRISHEMK